MEQEDEGMSAIVKGMEMPKNCMSCPFPAVGVDAYYCHCPTQDGKEYDFKYADTIPDTCPLVEISTPHGRLIDADVLKRSAHLDGRVKTCIDTWIDSQEAVIEAERDENEY
jgi:hypothetical protein